MSKVQRKKHVLQSFQIGWTISMRYQLAGGGGGGGMSRLPGTSSYGYDSCTVYNEPKDIYNTLHTPWLSDSSRIW